MRAVGNDDDGTGAGSDFGCFQLGKHAAAPAGRRPGSQGLDGGRDLADVRNEGRGTDFPTQADGVLERATIGVERFPNGTGSVGLGRKAQQTGDVGEQDESVSVHLAGDEGGKAVIVAEDAAFRALVDRLQFGGGDRVVFVDDRNYAQLEQLLDRAAKVGGAAALDEIVFGEQNLGDFDVVRLKEVLVGVHEQGLADSGTRLLGDQIVGASAMQAETAATHADGSGGNQNDLDAGVREAGDAGSQRFEALGRKAAVGRGDDIGSQLDDKAPRRLQAADTFLVKLLRVGIA